MLHATVVTQVKVSGFGAPGAKGQVEVQGAGKCRFRVEIFDLGKPDSGTFNKRFTDLVDLPQTIEVPGYAAGSYRAYVVSYDAKQCVIDAPNSQGWTGWSVDFKVPNSSGSSSGTGSGSSPPASGGGNGAKPANGSIASLQVPGGSFAEDEAQELQVSGSGGCAFDLQITNKSYGGNDDQTWQVGPKKLGPTILYNGTDLGTLAQGSYHAQVTGKNGCTGNAGIDFKVTEKTSTRSIKGQPAISFDKQPQGAGGAFGKSKDSNIWFKVTVPKAIKDGPTRRAAISSSTI